VTGRLASRLDDLKPLSRGRTAGKGGWVGTHTIQARVWKEKCSCAKERKSNLENSECINGARAPATGSEAGAAGHTARIYFSWRAMALGAVAGVVVRFLLGGVVARGLGGRSVYYEHV